MRYENQLTDDIVLGIRNENQHLKEKNPLMSKTERYKALESLFGFSEVSIRHVCQNKTAMFRHVGGEIDYNNNNPNSRAVCDEDAVNIRTRFKDGTPIWILADEFDVSDHTIKRVLLREQGYENARGGPILTLEFINAHDQPRPDSNPRKPGNRRKSNSKRKTSIRNAYNVSKIQSIIPEADLTYDKIVWLDTISEQDEKMLLVKTEKVAFRKAYMLYLETEDPSSFRNWYLQKQEWGKKLAEVKDFYHNSGVKEIITDISWHAFVVQCCPLADDYNEILAAAVDKNDIHTVAKIYTSKENLQITQSKGCSFEK